MNNLLHDFAAMEHERSEIIFAKIMRKIFTPELLSVIKENISKVEKLEINGGFKKSFKINLDDLEWIFNDFLSEALGGGAYARKLEGVFYKTNPNLETTRLVSCDHPDFNNPHVDENICMDIGPSGMLEPCKRGPSKVVLPIALCKQKDELTTTIGCLAVSVHEAGHAVAERNISGKAYKMKLSEIGEIESMIAERLFMFYMLMNQTKFNKHFTNKKHQPFADGLVGDGLIKRAYLDHFLESSRRLLENTEKITDTEHFSAYGSGFEKTKKYTARYVFGEVISTLFLNEYLLNSAVAIENLNNFVEHNHDISKFADTAEMLLSQTFEEMRKNPEDENKSWHELMIKRYIQISKNMAGEKIIEDYDENF